MSCELETHPWDVPGEPRFDDAHDGAVAVCIVFLIIAAAVWAYKLYVFLTAATEDTLYDFLWPVDRKIGARPVAAGVLDVSPLAGAGLVVVAILDMFFRASAFVFKEVPWDDQTNLEVKAAFDPFHLDIKSSGLWIFFFLVTMALTVVAIVPSLGLWREPSWSTTPPTALTRYSVYTTRIVESVLFLPIMYLCLDAWVCQHSNRVAGSATPPSERYVTGDCEAMECYNSAHDTLRAVSLIVAALLFLALTFPRRAAWTKDTALGLGLPHLLLGSMTARAVMAVGSKVVPFISPCAALFMVLLANTALTLMMALALDSRRADLPKWCLGIIILVEFLLTLLSLAAMFVFAINQDENSNDPNPGPSCLWLAGALWVGMLFYGGIVLWRRQLEAKPEKAPTPDLNASNKDEGEHKALLPPTDKTGVDDKEGDEDESDYPPGHPIIDRHPIVDPRGVPLKEDVEMMVVAHVKGDDAKQNEAEEKDGPRQPSSHHITIGDVESGGAGAGAGSGAGAQAGPLVVRVEDPADPDTTLRYQWYKDKRALIGKTSPSLVISPVTEDDYGDYLCRVSNDVGVVRSRRAHLVPVERARAETRLVDQHEASHPTFVTLVADTPPDLPGPFYYDWEYNGKPVTGYHGRSITVPVSDVKDLSKWRAKVTYTQNGIVQNHASTVRVASDVDLKAAAGGPTTTTTTTTSSTTTTTTRTASTNTNQSYQWFAHHSSLDHREDVLRVRRLTSVQDVAGHTAESMDHRNRQWRSVDSVHVFETESLDDLDRALPPPSPPPFPPVSVPSPVPAPLSVDEDDIPDTVALIAGRDLDMSRPAPGVQCQWYNGGAALSGETSHVLLLHGGVELDDLRNYTVVRDGKSWQVYPATPVKLTATVYDADPPITYLWWSEAHRRRAALSRNTTLWLPSMPLQQLVMHRCDVSSAMGVHPRPVIRVFPASSAVDGSYVEPELSPDTTSPATMTPTDVIPITRPPKPVALGHVGIRLLPADSPAPGTTFQWFKDDELLPTETAPSIEVIPVTSAHLGTYSCLVTTRSGQQTRVSQQLVPQHNAPRVVRQPRSQDVPVPTFPQSDASVKLSVAVADSTYPLPAYQWRRNTEVLPGETGPALHLTDLQSMTGWYTCDIQNSMGSVTTDPAEVRIVEPEDGSAVPTLVLRVVRDSMTSIVVEWDAPPVARTHPVEYRLSVHENLTAPGPDMEWPAEDADEGVTDPALDHDLHVQHFVISDGSTSYELDAFRGEPLNPGESFVFSLAVRTQDGSMLGVSPDSMFSPARGGAGGLWGTDGGLEGWTEDEDVWVGECEPLNASTRHLSPGQRVVELGGRFPRIYVKRPLLFDTNKATLLGATHEDDLRLVAALLLANPDVKCTIEGHVNYCKTPQSALELSTGRATTVRDKLVELGVAAHRLKAVGFGERRTMYPKGSRHSYRNRRVQFVLVPPVWLTNNNNRKE